LRSPSSRCGGSLDAERSRGSASLCAAERFSVSRGSLAPVAQKPPGSSSEPTPGDAGEILLDGKPFQITSPSEAVKAGLALVPEDRGLQGLVLKLPVQENIVLATLNRHSAAGWMDRPLISQTARQFVERLSIKTPHLGQKAMLLSGGNQQKVVLAKWLASHPKVLIMDEPTRGIDVGAKAEVHALMSQLARTGIGIIMISSDLTEIMAMSDRIVVMHEGSIAAILERSEATQELVMAYASGQQKR
jgi:ABC-type sugar transport system ATPase subunit